jgi:hypothetical protein
MKAKVLREFKDKYNGKIYKKGQVINVTKERFDEILTVDKLVEEVVEAKKTTKKAPKKDAE